MDDLWKMYLLAVVFAVASTLFILQGVEVEWSGKCGGWTG